MKKRLAGIGSVLLVFGSLVVMWRLLILAFNIPPYLLPTPLSVAKVSIQKLPELWSAMMISGEAAIGGLLASIVFGIFIALIFARSPWIRKMFFPYTILLQTVPILAVAPLIIIWVGPGLLAVGVVTFVICLAPIIANTTQGLVSVDENLVQLFLMHKASQGQILSRLRLPHALPYLFVGVRISSGIAVIGALTGEWFAGSGRVGQGGLGYSILYAQAQLQTAYLFALVIAATVLGFTLFFTVMFFEWLALHKWHESALSAGSASE
ncbi:MAG: ABC transporter permease [Acidobacteriaceae bacterium]